MFHKTSESRELSPKSSCSTFYTKKFQDSNREYSGIEPNSLSLIQKINDIIHDVEQENERLRTMLDDVLNRKHFKRGQLIQSMTKMKGMVSAWKDCRNKPTKQSTSLMGSFREMR